MTHQAFDDAEISAVKLAAERVVRYLHIQEEADKLAICRTVLDVAAESEQFDPDKLFELAVRRLQV